LGKAGRYAYGHPACYKLGNDGRIRIGTDLNFVKKSSGRPYRLLQVEIKEKRMEKIKKVQEYFLYFMCYSVIGWLYEVFLEVVVYRWGFSNRGVLFGPYCVVYGFGAVILLLSLRPLMDKRIRIGKLCITPMLVFLGIVVITTLVELFASYLM